MERGLGFYSDLGYGLRLNHNFARRFVLGSLSREFVPEYYSELVPKYFILLFYFINFTAYKTKKSQLAPFIIYFTYKVISDDFIHSKSRIDVGQKFSAVPQICREQATSKVILFLNLKLEFLYPQL